MSSKIDRLHDKAMEHVEREWMGLADTAASMLERAVTREQARAVRNAAFRYADAPTAVNLDGLPDGFPSWFDTFTDRFRRAEEDGILPRNVPHPPEEPANAWGSALDRAAEGKGMAVLVLAFARGVRRKQERGPPIDVAGPPTE